jgi:hypothetical protein
MPPLTQRPLAFGPMVVQVWACNHHITHRTAPSARTAPASTTAAFEGTPERTAQPQASTGPIRLHVCVRTALAAVPCASTAPQLDTQTRAPLAPRSPLAPRTKERKKDLHLRLARLTQSMRTTEAPRTHTRCAPSQPHNIPFPSRQALRRPRHSPWPALAYGRRRRVPSPRTPRARLRAPGSPLLVTRRVRGCARLVPPHLSHAAPNIVHLAGRGGGGRGSATVRTALQAYQKTNNFNNTRATHVTAI